MDCPTDIFWIVISAFIIFVFLTWVLVIDPKSLDKAYRPPENETGSDDHDEHGNAEFIAGPKGNKPPARSDQRNSKDERSYSLEWRSYCVEVLTLVAIFVYAGLTYRLLRNSDRANRIAQDTYESAEGARVMIGGIEPKGFGQENAGIDIAFVNVGHRDAKNLVVDVATEYIPNPTKGPPVSFAIPTKIPEHQSTKRQTVPISGTQLINIKFNLPPDKEYLPKVLNDEVLLYVWGTFYYEFFGNKTTVPETFCYVYLTKPEESFGHVSHFDTCYETVPAQK